MCLICIGFPQHYTRERFSFSVECRHFCKAFPGRVFIAREETFACSIHFPTLIRLASTLWRQENTVTIVTVFSVPVLYQSMARPLGFQLLWALRHNFILIYFRVFMTQGISRPIICPGEPIDFNLICFLDVLIASFNTHNCDTKIELLLAKSSRSKWEGRTLTPHLFFSN